MRSHASDDNRWRRAAGGVLNSQSEGAPATELADVRLGSTSASGAYSGGLPLADASSKSAASPSAAAAAPPPLKRKLTSKFFSVVANAVRESEPSVPLQRYWLKVVVWSATNVCDVGQVADPHVKLHVLHGGALHREVQRTPTVRNNREPEWDAPFLLHAPSLSDASLVLSVYDTDQLSADDLLAYIVLPMSALASDAQLAAAGGGSTTSVFSENSTESPVPEAEPRNFELQLRPSNAQIKRHESMSLFGARSTEPEPIRLRVSACLHRSSRRPMQSGVLPASSHGSTSAPSSGRVGTPVERADSGDFPPRELSAKCSAELRGGGGGGAATGGAAIGGGSSAKGKAASGKASPAGFRRLTSLEEVAEMAPGGTPVTSGALPLDAAGDLEDEATAAARRASPMTRSACGTSGLCVGAFVSNEV